MKSTALIIIIVLIAITDGLGQSRLVDVEQRTFQTKKDIEIEGEIGYLEVPENRKDPDSRVIKVKYARLKSLAENPEAPIIYVEGGGGTCVWQAEDPEELTYWIQLLEVSDLIFIDRRGEDDESLVYVWEAPLPEDVFVTEAAANAHYDDMVQAALQAFDVRGVDVRGYNLEELATDVDELMTALTIDRYSIYGFSYGSSISMALMSLFPERIERAVLAGSDAPQQALNYPRYLDEQVTLLSEMVREDDGLSSSIPDFEGLVHRVMTKLEKDPAVVTIKNPLTGEDMDLKIGAFGLALILRLDIDDYNDIPVMPRLLYTIDQGDYSILTWFAQRRVVYAMAVPGSGINQQLASGASDARWAQIEEEAATSIFGNVVNFPFSAAKDHWLENALSFDPTAPTMSSIPTLFITGDLDCRTPVKQVEEIANGFRNAVHVVVENAGHEQAQWDADVSDRIIPNFFRGQEITTTEVFYSEIEFIKVKGRGKGHPSLD